MNELEKVMESRAVFSGVPDGMLRMIPQHTVRMAEAEEEEHNSSWDYAISPDGRHFFSVCAESLHCQYLRLYEYLPDENLCRRILRFEDAAITYPRAIRASKIHSSLSFLPDGRVLFATHTTAAAPGHPRWMPFAYYDHLWEGYPGSNILIWDPKDGKTEDLGIPVQRESIYGGQYEPSTDSFYFFGYHRGHAYRFDLKTRKVTDFGQATEFGTWRAILGQDGNIYGTTASGRLLRINIEKQRLEDIPFSFPYDPELITMGTNNKLMHFVNHPDGCLYFSALSCRNFMRYDYRTQKIEIMATLVPGIVDEAGMKGRCMGMAADREGVIWYLCEVLGFGALLCRWDPHGGKPPESLGLFGTRDRVFRASFGCFIRHDTLFANDTNRAENAHVAVLQVKLEDLRKNAGNAAELTRDPLLWLTIAGGREQYREITGRELSGDVEEALETADALRRQRDSEAFRRTLPVSFSEEQRRRFYGDNALNATHLPYTRCRVAKIWQTKGLYGSELFDVAFDPCGDILATILKADGEWERLKIRDGEIIKREATEAVGDRSVQPGREYTGITLPCRPERNHLADATAWCLLADGERLIGTRDGMLALLRSDGTVFSLGAVDDCGAVHALAASPDGQSAFGAAGDRDGLGMLFRYSRRTGITLYGRLFFHDANIPGLIGASNQPYYIAWSPDGKSLAVGVKDRLACVWRFELPESLQG